MPGQIRKGDLSKGGSNGIVKQPNYTLTEKNDGTIEGSIDFVGDKSKIALFPKMKTAHPDEPRCQIYNREFIYLPNGLLKMTASYFGLMSSKTTPVISYSPNQDKDEIETHPDFKDFAGTKSSPKNGAKFDDDTGEFLGFFDPDVTELCGVRHYIVPSTMVQVTYWQNTVPTLRKRMSIVSSIQGFRKPSDVKNFLLLDFPYRQIGDYYQTTEQYLGSGPNGWSKKIYK